jgi:hypothetical protein
MMLVSAFMGLGCDIGRWPTEDVTKLGAIISSVTTSGLNGQTPIFLKAAQIVSGVNAF